MQNQDDSDSNPQNALLKFERNYEQRKWQQY